MIDTILDNNRYSQQSFELMKEAVEIDIMRTWLNHQEFLESSIKAGDFLGAKLMIGKNRDEVEQAKNDLKDSAKKIQVTKDIEKKESGFLGKIWHFIQSLFNKLINYVKKLWRRLTNVFKNGYLYDKTLDHEERYMLQQKMLNIITSIENSGKKLKDILFGNNFAKYAVEVDKYFDHFLDEYIDSGRYDIMQFRKESYIRISKEAKLLILVTSSSSPIRFDFKGTKYEGAIQPHDLYAVLKDYRDNKVKNFDNLYKRILGLSKDGIKNFELYPFKQEDLFREMNELENIEADIFDIKTVENATDVEKRAAEMGEIISKTMLVMREIIGEIYISANKLSTIIMNLYNKHKGRRATITREITRFDSLSEDELNNLLTSVDLDKFKSVE